MADRLDLQALRDARQERKTAEPNLPSFDLQGLRKARQKGLALSVPEIIEPTEVQPFDIDFLDVPDPTDLIKRATPALEAPSAIETRAEKLPAPTFPSDTPRDIRPYPEYSLWRELKTIGEAINIATDPRTPEGQKFLKEGVLGRLENIGVRVFSPVVGRIWDLMGDVDYKYVKQVLAEQEKEMGGFGKAVVPATADTLKMAVEWGVMYPALFRSAGISSKAVSKIPKVAKANQILHSSKLATKYPRLFDIISKTTGSFFKGAAVGGAMGGLETIGEELSAGEVLKHTSKSAAILGGTAAAFQLASQVDTARYIKQLRNTLIKASNQRFAAEIARIEATWSPGPARTAAMKGLTSFKTNELQDIDSIVSSAEAQLRGLKKGKLYQQGQEMVESPEQAARRFITQGFKTKRPYTKGEPLLKKGLGEVKPFIKMPTTRTGEIREELGEAAKAIRHPVRVVSKVGRAKPIAAPRMPLKPPTAPPIGEVITKPAAERKLTEPTVTTTLPEKIAPAKPAEEIEPPTKPAEAKEAKVDLSIYESLKKEFRKEPWQVTLNQLLRSEAAGHHETPIIMEFHRRLLQDAIKAGKEIPANVIKPYISEPWAQEALAKEKPTMPESVAHQAAAGRKPTELAAKRRPVEILPKKKELLAEIDTAIAKAPSETEVRSRLQKEIPEPASTLPQDEYIKAMQEKQSRINEAINKVTSEKLTFDIDGGAEITNTKETLMTFRKSVAGLPEKEYWPAKPTKPTVKKPIAAIREKIEPLLAAPEGYFTDGKVLVKGTLPTKAKPKVKDRWGQEPRPISEKSIDEIISADTEPAELQHYAVISPVAGKGISRKPIAEISEEGELPALAVFKSAGKYYGYEQSRFNVLRKRFPDARFGINQQTGNLIAYDPKTSQPVAALTPIQLGEEGPALDKPPVEISLPAEQMIEASFFEPTLALKSLQTKREQIKAMTQPEPVHLSKVVIDTFRQWPKEIKKVGKDYWVEVMATVKKLGPPMRYKALRKTMLGAFRLRKGPVVPTEVIGIELQDVRDALTATHELGHEIDWLLNDKKYPSSIKGRFPETQVGEMALRGQLKKVSQVLRPDLWEEGAKLVGRKSYTTRHTELMADFVSLYTLDPEKARELAPDVKEAFESKLATKPELFDAISRLQDVRFSGPVEPAIAEHIRETFPLPKEFSPLQLVVDMTDKSYVKAAEELGITAARHYKLLMEKARRDADRLDTLVPDKARQTDLVVIAENGKANPWTEKTKQEILKEGLTKNERKAIKLYRAYQEHARQTVNKYLRGADIAEYIKFIDDYFVHAYETPLTEKYKTAIARWAKRSPQAKKRVLPDLATAVEIGLKPRAKTLGDGLRLWAGINYRVATNKAFLRILPQITNDNGVSILQKPQDYPHWPTVDYWPIRQNYAVPLPNRGVLLFQGRVAVDPRVKTFIDAMFGRKVFNTPVRIIEGFNALAKAFELTLFSFFHHQAEFFSAMGALGPRALPFVGGYYGKRARAFGKKPKLWGFLPAHITTLQAGRQLETCPEFLEDYIAAGGQLGYISTEGINLMERMLKSAANYLEDLVQREPTGPLKGVFGAAYVPVKTAQAAYSFHQRLLWDNVQRAKLVAYYNIVADGAKNSDLPIKQVKETAAKYIADNFGGQEWLNTMFRRPKVRQFWTQLMMSLDWTWSQIKTARWPFAYGGKTKTEKLRQQLMRKIGRHHWFWYLAAIAGFTVGGNYALNGKGPWENEYGHKLDIDWTNLWRKLPWNRDWKERGDYSRRYIGVGKAGRELVRWVTSPLRAFGYKLSPGARTLFEQTTGYNIGSDFPEPWAREDLQLYQEVYARFKNVMEKFKPFSFSGNNAFLAFPSRKGMTQWKAIRSYEEIYQSRAKLAMGGIGAALTKASQILSKNEQKLRSEIAEACKLNEVDAQKADRAALAGVRSKHYRLFWKATKKSPKTAAKLCNAYANALIELGVTPRGFKQSLRYRQEQIPKQARRIGVEAFEKAAEKAR